MVVRMKGMRAPHPINNRTWKGGLSLDDDAWRAPPRPARRDRCSADPGGHRGAAAAQEAAAGAGGTSAAREGSGAAVAPRAASEGSGEASPVRVRAARALMASRTPPWRRIRAPAHDMSAI